VDDHCFNRGFSKISVLALLAFGWVSLQTGWAASPSDDFIRGYASAIIAMNYPGSVESIRVDKGVVYLQPIDLSEEEKLKLRKMLSNAEGVVGVEFVTEKKLADTPGAQTIEKKEAAASGEHLPVFLPANPLFQPLLADPRWPHFSASFQRYLDDQQLRNVASTNFGESFGIYRFRGPWNSTMELGIQAGVFAIFDLDSESFDLINADYLVGIPFTIKKGSFSNLTRIYHQSSHLGDEFLLRGRADERINLSYEGVNSVISYDLPAGFRRGLYLPQRTFGPGALVYPFRTGIPQPLVMAPRGIEAGGGRGYPASPGKRLGHRRIGPCGDSV
jgi:hypothetical protein